MKLTLAVVLLVAIAQIPSCNIDSSGADTVVGYVEDKYMAPVNTGPVPFILIAGTEYQVPLAFWHEVAIGDLVKYEKGVWKIIRKVGT